ILLKVTCTESWTESLHPSTHPRWSFSFLALVFMAFIHPSQVEFQLLGSGFHGLHPPIPGGVSASWLWFSWPSSTHPRWSFSFLALAFMAFIHPSQWSFSFDALGFMAFIHPSQVEFQLLGSGFHGLHPSIPVELQL
ncbi:hypothetical protein BgiBS90_027359, partial [Biomphalaria glabrata]